LKRESKLYLNDILEAIDRINNYTSEIGIEELKKQNLIIDAVLRNLEVIGEAATQVETNIKNEFPEVPWRNIQDFRIVVAHHYWKINIERIWDIIQNKLEKLEKQITEILEK